MTTHGTSTHRLACAMFADLVGYTRLVEADEHRTLSAFDEIREGLVQTALKEQQGRFVKSTGDGFLAEFGTATGAVECGIAIQRAMVARTTEPHLGFRIGVHLGEIVEGNGDIFGRAVNVAARLQTLCEPEGLCISNAVFESVAGKVSGQFLDGGMR